jgi:threonine/homoserine/homoserine lactone efflux protein
VPSRPLPTRIYPARCHATIGAGTVSTFVVIRLALSEGRRQATVAVLGMAIGNLGWLTMVLGGTHLLFGRTPGLVEGLRLIGGVL